MAAVVREAMRMRANCGSMFTGRRLQLLLLHPRRLGSSTNDACDVNTPDRVTGLTPLMKAVDDGDTDAIKTMLAAVVKGRVTVDGRDKEQSTVFHHVANSSNERITQLFNDLDKHILGNSLDAVNKDGKTPFQLAAGQEKITCALGLLVNGADVDKALQAAIGMDNPEFVKMTSALGANVNQTINGNCLLRAVQDSHSANRDEILAMLRRVGATLAAADDRVKADRTATNQPNGESESTSNGKQRVLCLDGGGIRGLMLIRLLQAIEQEVGRPIKDCFDLISGTSTGGILALALLRGKSLRYCLGSYLRLKDDVFSDGPPYDPEPLEAFLKGVFGEETLMSEYSVPRVFVTTAIADRKPIELCLFRNYNNPREDDELSWNKQLMWKAARSTSAAPFFFPEFEHRFLDGGLIANNPTIDTLTEIQQLNEALKSKGSPTLPAKVVVSIGTGQYCSEPSGEASIYGWRHPSDLLRSVIGAIEIIKIFADQSLEHNGRTVDRAAAWCTGLELPFYRLNPLLTEHIQLDCTDDRELIQMLFETQCFVYDNKCQISELAKLL